jgi:hypothetical protein
MTDLLHQKLKTTPFRPLHLVLLHGGRYNVTNPQDVLMISEFLFLRQGREGLEVHDNILEIPLAWIERLEGMPSGPD